MNPAFVNNLFELNAASFNKAVVEAFRFQLKESEIYRTFCQMLGKQNWQPGQIAEIPFLPISFFKTHSVVTTNFHSHIVFESSGTSQTIQSRHYVQSIELYEQSFFKAFELNYGKSENYCILGLLPSYLERQHSSLVYMVKRLMDKSHHPANGFYLNEWDKLYETLQQLNANKQPVILFGVTFGLLDFAEKYRLNCTDTIIIETGGMKGRREELTREEVHKLLKESFGVENVHSEYGMTELMSQAYSQRDGLFRCPPWMKVFVRDEYDPQLIKTTGKGAINIIDLANIYSCCFIATDDVGEVYEDGSFKVLGRIDNSDIRGCSLLAL